MITRGKPQQFGSDNCWERVSELLQNVHSAGRHGPVEQIVDNLLYVRSKRFNPVWRKGLRSQRPKPSVCRRIHKEHLPDHHVGDGGHIGYTHTSQSFWSWRTLRRQVLKDPHHIEVSRNHPSVEE